MSDVAIRVEGLAKQYKIGPRARYKSLRDSLAGAARWPLHRRPGGAQASGTGTSQERFWALQDVSFEVKQGEAVGIIGRNGAGKSTLLKLLTRITEPTAGTIDLWGRVGSLLEVGTGFHPELTGRENVYMNGSILGMTRAEIARRFDEIVAFAEVEKFLDTPVKHYSSGMYMRLAFAVAAHLDPEILVVDEVLAVGDAAFQRRCLGKMDDAAKSGRTVLFVSHNLNAIRRLCTRAFLLRSARLALSGTVDEIIDEYTSEADSGSAEYVHAYDPDKPVNLCSVTLLNSENEPATEVQFQEGFTVRIKFAVNKVVRSCIIWVSVRTREEVNVMDTADYDLDEGQLGERLPGSYCASVSLPGRLLNAGAYYLVVGITGQAPVIPYERVEAIQFHIVDTCEYSLQEAATRGGLIKPLLPWLVRRAEPSPPSAAVAPSAPAPGAQA